MTEKEAIEIVKQAGWTPRVRILPGKKARMLYAYKRIEGRVTERYIGTLFRIERFTPEDIIKKLK